MESLERALRDITLVVDARFGGLGTTGLLDDAADSALTADDNAAWKEVGFRIEDVSAEKEMENRRKRVKPFYFALERNDEGEDVRLLVVEKRQGESKSEDDRALSPRPQLLAEHQSWAALKAHALAGALGLGADLAGALEIAARLHDEGKQAKRWQQAFNAPADGIYAKTKGPVKFGLLGGYRHEFGSLFHAEKDEKFKNLPAEMQDLVLHLIAAHHGRARPTIATEGCEDAPPSVLEGRARDVALRFARLNARWGPWGLAWLEALLRAADQQASRANDKREEANG
jgi:CRISPR-associated endonuclease/helicase Cas3